MSEATDRIAYSKMWANVLGSHRVAQCTCGRCGLGSKLPALEREGWTWRLVAGALSWRCPDCKWEPQRGGPGGGPADCEPRTRGESEPPGLPLCDSQGGT
jgi:hypothetical protein